LLEILGIKLVGRHHSGIDDSKNIAACAVKLINDGYEYTVSDVTTLKEKKWKTKIIKSLKTKSNAGFFMNTLEGGSYIYSMNKSKGTC